MITDMKKLLIGALILQISQNYIYSQSALEKALSHRSAAPYKVTNSWPEGTGSGS